MLSNRVVVRKSNMPKDMIGFATRCTNLFIKQQNYSNIELAQAVLHIKSAFDQNFPANWNVVLGFDVYTALRLKTYCILAVQGVKHNGESKPLSVIIFKVISHLNDTKAVIALDDSESYLEDLRSKTKVLLKSPSISDADVNHHLSIIDNVHKTCGSDADKFVMEVRKKLNDNLGLMWHVAVARMGDIYVAHPALAEDTFLEVGVGKFKVVAWKHVLVEVNPLLELATSPPVIFSVLALLALLAWWRMRGCVPTVCHARASGVEPCTLEELSLEVSQCESRVTAVLLVSITMFVSALVARRVGGYTENARRRKFLERASQDKKD